MRYLGVDTFMKLISSVYTCAVAATNAAIITYRRGPSPTKTPDDEDWEQEAYGEGKNAREQ